MRDKSCVKTLSFKASLDDAMYIPKGEAVANSAHWAFEEPESGDDADPPAADFGTFDKGSSSTTPLDPPATVEKPGGKKRKAA
eukprot:6450764-Prymnesium_polylepis.1